ncbi:F0F1 ATP synthase subunit delta [bacterium]|nr:MAG: F0F1 ATP synthase subunit delta [bacterium]
MKGDLSVARRYASALFAVAKKRGAVESIAANLNDVVVAIESSRELAGVLHHPLLSRDKKRVILHKIFGGSISADVENFLFLVVEKDRADILPQILNEYYRLFDEYRGQADGIVVSAVPLTQAQVTALQSALQKKFGVQVRLKTRVDENLIGGLIVRVGDKLIDSSVASRLQTMNEQLKRVKVA